MTTSTKIFSHITFHSFLKGALGMCQTNCASDIYRCLNDFNLWSVLLQLQELLLMNECRREHLAQDGLTQ